MAKNIEEQLTIFRKFSEPRFVGRMKVGCLALTLILVIGNLVAGYYLEELGFLFFAFIVGFMAIGVLHKARQITPHQDNARLALDHFASVTGSVRIVVTTDDGTDTCTASLRDQQGRDWSFGFHATEWKPQTGDHAAEFRYIDGIDWPVLVITAAGILYPDSTPKQEALALPEAEAPQPGGRILGILAGCIILGIGVFILVGAWGTYLKDTGIANSGMVAEAIVVKAGHLVAKRGESHGLVYRFTLADGNVIERNWTQEEEHWKRYRVGDSIRIHYDPDHPGRNFPEGAGVTSLGMTLFISAFGLIFAIFGGMILFGGLRRKNRPHA